MRRKYILVFVLLTHLLIFQPFASGYESLTKHEMAEYKGMGTHFMCNMVCNDVARCNSLEEKQCTAILKCIRCSSTDPIRTCVGPTTGGCVAYDDEELFQDCDYMEFTPCYQINGTLYCLGTDWAWWKLDGTKYPCGYEYCEL